MDKGKIIKLNRTTFVLNALKDLYAMPNMYNKYSTAYILECLFKPEEITRELTQTIEIIINRKNKNGKTEARVA